MPKKTRKAKVRASRRPINSGYAEPMPRTLERDEEDVIRQPQALPGPVPSYGRIAAAARSASPIVSDYGYVFRDLRRIAILAGLFFAIMIVLWYVIEVQHIPLIPGLM